MLLPILGPSSLPVVVAQPDDRHANLCWSGMTDTKHASGSNDEESMQKWGDVAYEFYFAVTSVVTGLKLCLEMFRCGDRTIWLTFGNPVLMRCTKRLKFWNINRSWKCNVYMRRQSSSCWTKQEQINHCKVWKNATKEQIPHQKKYLKLLRAVSWYLLIFRQVTSNSERTFSVFKSSWLLHILVARSHLNFN